MISFSLINFSNNLSWDKVTNLIFKLQKRLFKVSYVYDRKKLYVLQKIIVQLNYSRLLAIKLVNHSVFNENLPGVDGYVSLNFYESFELNEFLKYNWNNWIFQNLKKVSLFDNDGKIIVKKVPVISDRVWCYLVKFAIEPVHEALFHPFNLGYRSQYFIYEIQELILLNLSKFSFGSKKRVLKLDLSQNFCINNYSFLMEKLIAPRCIKLGIFKLLEKGFVLEFSNNCIFNKVDFSSLLLNIFLNGIEKLHNCIRYGYFLLFFLNPIDNEKELLSKIYLFLSKLDLKFNISEIELSSIINGFDFLGWHFKFSYKSYNNLCIFPSFDNYNKFLTRIKVIINNSNYGSIIKASKIYPIVKDWKEYHKYSDLFDLNYSLCFIKKRAFKIFKSESKQDFYSSKSLLLKCFSVFNIFNKDLKNLYNKFFKPLNFRHLVFLFNRGGEGFKYFYFCIHCGVILL
uniref:Maturase-like protein 1 n=1 Tax=Euglena longa TaxID=3037 RepID=MAT1_EUGLO|nr:hypothetical protein AsloCp40 [Euglena longa]P14761.1 RecName: Full=Maturase-like protein 1 [Euglena longa]CAC24611.1 hypothetical protein [Euglena longa]